MSTCTDKKAALGNDVLQLRCGMVTNQEQARILIEIIIELFQRDTVVVTFPNDMWYQSNGGICVIQDISDESFVVCIGCADILFIFDNHRTDIDADNLNIREAFVRRAFFRLHIERRIRHLYSIDSDRFNGFIGYTLSGCNQGIITQIFRNRRFCHDIRLNRATPKNRFNMLLSKCPVQICVHGCIAIAIIVSTDRKCHIGTPTQLLNHGNIIQPIHISVVSCQLQLGISLKKSYVPSSFLFSRNDL